MFALLVFLGGELLSLSKFVDLGYYPYNNTWRKVISHHASLKVRDQNNFLVETENSYLLNNFDSMYAYFVQSTNNGQ